MIITLTGADFSQNNIGTLNSWRIVRALQGASTTNNTTAVAKGAQYKATFIINDGYEYASSSITMGGQPIEANITWNGEKTQAEVNIPQVTGNVYISIIANVKGGSVKPQLDAPIISIS